MNKQIEDKISKCPMCNENQNKNIREPMIPNEVPNLPWYKVATDLFEIIDYRLLIQLFWNLLTTTYSKSDSDQLHEISFCKIRSPCHPQLNGLAERSVQTAKKLLKKAQADHADPYLALLAHRNTPTNEMLGSPAQRLTSRRTKTILPTSEELLKPQVVKNVKEKINQERTNMSYYDRHTKPLPSLRWKPAVVEVYKTHRSYILRSGGSVLRRNRKDIRENSSAVEREYQRNRTRS
ncbi:uncharacterized protein LOC118202312 [Stegodyphus dumicola]|uniref:uncharacterized protein LOC118202312 n=1 Tax=Stegodyphus dumicola TaxID=202533 RepID=UPI0015AB1EC1|nr:uncharacterized protein LOC118202312 [Stegodyphus dumicola]